MKKGVRIVVCVTAGLFIPAAVSAILIFVNKQDNIPEPEDEQVESSSEEVLGDFNPYTPEPTEEPSAKMTKEEADALQNRLEESMLIVNEEIPLNPNERVYDEDLNVPYWMQMTQTEDQEIKETIEKYAIDFLTTNWTYDDSNVFYFNPYSDYGFSTLYTVDTVTELARESIEDNNEKYDVVTYQHKINLFTFVGISLEESTEGHIQMYIYRTESERTETVRE